MPKLKHNRSRHSVESTLVNLNDATMEPDLVNSPPHYQAGGLEVIEVIEAFAPDNFLRGSAIKYLLRAGRKGDALTDLKKSSWMLRREIDNLERMEPV